MLGNVLGWSVSKTSPPKGQRSSCGQTIDETGSRKGRWKRVVNEGVRFLPVGLN